MQVFHKNEDAARGAPYLFMEIEIFKNKPK